MVVVAAGDAGVEELVVEVAVAVWEDVSEFDAESSASFLSDSIRVAVSAADSPFTPI